MTSASLASGLQTLRLATEAGEAVKPQLSEQLGALAVGAKGKEASIVIVALLPHVGHWVS